MATVPETLPATDVRVPDVVGEVNGWRAWRLVGTKTLPRLMSVTHTPLACSRDAGADSIWPPGRWFRATCPEHVETVPDEGHTCGIYAARSREHLIALGYGVYADEENRVVGEIAYAGKVIPGSQGYRGELARVKRLIVPYELWEWVEPLERAYHVPATVGFLFGPNEER